MVQTCLILQYDTSNFEHSKAHTNLIMQNE
jgi:hypothetical protein